MSQLLHGDYQAVAQRLDEPALRLLFTWLALLFFKIHLKDRSVRLHKDPRSGSEVVGDGYDWGGMHHLHAIARSPYTKASFLADVIGSLRIYEITGELTHDSWDYLDFSHDQTMVIRLGRVGIVATLNDSTASESAWSDRLDVINGPISEVQLREIGAMFALANRNLIYRPVFSTLVHNKTFAMIACKRPPLHLQDFDPKAFGEVLLFAVRNYVEARAITVDGSRDPKKVAAAIASGDVRFLTFKGEFIKPEFFQ